MDPLIAILLAFVALLIGAALGWFLGTRPLSDLKNRAAAQDDKVKALVVDLATMSERAARADSLAVDLDRSRSEREGLGSELATLKANAVHFEEQKRLLISAREEMLKEFQNTGHAVLSRAQETFMATANERFTHTEKVSEEKLKALLAPVSEKLSTYEQQVRSLEEKRVDAFGQLTGQIEEMRKGQEAVRAEAARLGNSLRSAPKVRGNWGEQQLRNVLDQCGLSEHTDFWLEHSVNTEDGRLRPDAIVRIPGGKQLVIDSKVSLNFYQDAFDTDDESIRTTRFESHAAAMRNHVQQLGAKAYFSQFENAPDYVVMFVPGEHFISAAMEHDSKLWDYAFERRVLIASPTNLVAIARTISQVWQHEGLAKEAREIGRMASDLYDSIAKTQDDLTKVGTHLGRAVNSFNDFSRTYDGNVLSRARRLTEKHIKIGKREIIEDVPLVEALPRREKPIAASKQDDGDEATE